MLPRFTTSLLQIFVMFTLLIKMQNVRVLFLILSPIVSIISLSFQIEHIADISPACVVACVV